MRFLKALALAVTVFVVTAGATTWLRFQTHARPLILSETDAIPPMFPVVVMEPTDSGGMQCRVRYFSDLDPAPTTTRRSFSIASADRARCSAELKEQVRIPEERVLAASVRFGPAADLGPEDIEVFATWDDDLFNRGTYLATATGFRPSRYERYHGGTIAFTSVATGIVVGLFASILVVCIWSWRTSGIASSLRVFAFSIGAILVGVVALIVIVRRTESPEARAKGRTLARLEMLRIGLADFESRHGRYPSESEGLAVLGSGLDPSLRGPFSIDGWGREFRYRSIDDRRVGLHSLGSNGIDEDGAGDDIEAAPLPGKQPPAVP